MNSARTSFTITVPLSLSARKWAQKLRQQQPNVAKATQVYLNTLAVYAVKLFLEWRGFTPSLLDNSILLSLLDTASLELPGLGKLECRPVLPNSEVMRVPEEVWSDRMGYVAVQLHDSLKEATLLGFVDQIDRQELPLTKLRSLDRFLPYLQELEAAKKSESVRLSQWLDSLVESGWETVDSLFNLSNSRLAFNFRRRQLDEQVKRGKVLHLEQTGEEIILLLSVTPTETPEIDISVELFPKAINSELPENLQLMILDETGKTVMQAEAGNSESLEFQFSGVPGESFSVKVVLAQVGITESFVI